jgi:PASTA domain
MGNHPSAAAPAGESGIGIAADTGAHVWLTGSTVFDNTIGLKTFARQGAPGVIDSFCDNQIVGNADNGTAPNELCPKPVNHPPDVITETVPVPGPPQCVVPRLKGLPVAFAKRLLSAANCGLGKVTKKKARRRSQVGKVLSQKTRAGTALAQGTKVAVTVGRR